MSSLAPGELEAIEQDLAALRARGPRDLEAALRRTLVALHRLTGEALDATTVVRQLATVALADVRDIANGEPRTDQPAATRAGHLRLVQPADAHQDSPWPVADPLGGEEALA